jgi:hypothetical protein
MFNEEIKETPAVSRLKNLQRKGHIHGLGSLLRADDSNLNDQKETLEAIMLPHFPKRHLISEAAGAQTEDGKKVKWAKNKPLKPNKSPGPEQIVPDMLRKRH